MICPKCNKQSPGNWPVCVHCGTPVKLCTANTCNALSFAEAKFCRRCGVNLNSYSLFVENCWSDPKSSLVSATSKLNEKSAALLPLGPAPKGGVQSFKWTSCGRICWAERDANQFTSVIPSFRGSLDTVANELPLEWNGGLEWQPRDSQSQTIFASRNQLLLWNHSNFARSSFRAVESAVVYNIQDGTLVQPPIPLGGDAVALFLCKGGEYSVCILDCTVVGSGGPKVRKVDDISLGKLDAEGPLPFIPEPIEKVPHNLFVLDGSRIVVVGFERPKETDGEWRVFSEVTEPFAEQKDWVFLRGAVATETSIFTRALKKAAGREEQCRVVHLRRWGNNNPWRLSEIPGTSGARHLNAFRVVGTLFLAVAAAAQVIFLDATEPTGNPASSEWGGLDMEVRSVGTVGPLCVLYQESPSGGHRSAIRTVTYLGKMAGVGSTAQTKVVQWLDSRVPLIVGVGMGGLVSNNGRLRLAWWELNQPVAS